LRPVRTCSPAHCSSPATTRVCCRFDASRVAARNGNRPYAKALPRTLGQAPLIQANPPLQQLLRQHAETLLARLPSVSLSARVIGLLGEQLAHGGPAT